MLSQAAFNAFLKTLEEPPEHAIFILATTEKHKILPTILSRCQVFNFSRITVEDAAEHLQYVAKSENIEFEPEALNIIAQKADGAMRDALSIFDQIVSFSGNKITYEKTIANLNVLDYDYFFKLTDAFLNEDITTSLITFDEILDKGFDGLHFLSGLAKHFRDLLVAQDDKTVNLIEVGANIKTQYVEQSKKCTPWFLFQALKTVNEAELNYRQSQNKRLTVELAVITLCNLLELKKKVN
jgi:DNA polymerase-3 subunit gamma/tau